MPTSSDVVIALPAGLDLHARPAGVFVKTAMKFGARTVVTYQGKTADAKSILAVLALGVVGGSSFEVHAEGDDAGAAGEALATCLDNLK